MVVVPLLNASAYFCQLKMMLTGQKRPLLLTGWSKVTHPSKQTNINMMSDLKHVVKRKCLAEGQLPHQCF